MKKIFALFMFVLVAFSFSAKAQFEKGDKYINVGLNVGGTLGGGTGVGAAYEVGVHDFISVGGEADFVNWNSFGFRYNYISFGGRANYHFGKHFIENDKWDLYGGLALGYRNSSTNAVVNVHAGGIYWGPQVGARYFFKPNMAGLAEVGNTAAALKLGLSFKL